MSDKDLADLELESSLRKERIARLIGNMKDKSAAMVKGESAAKVKGESAVKVKGESAAKGEANKSSAAVKAPTPPAFSRPQDLGGGKLMKDYERKQLGEKLNRKGTQGSGPQPLENPIPPTPRSPVKDHVSSALIQQGIEERAKQRKERALELQRAAENRARKLKNDEKMQQAGKILEEEAKLIQYQLDRKLQLNALKENAQRGEKEMLEMKEKRQKAVAFNRKQILVRCAFVPMLRLVEVARNNWFTAVNFCDDYLLQQAWMALYGYCANIKKERIRKEFRQGSLAISHYKHKLLSALFKRWSLYRKMLRAKALAVTGHFSRFTANRRAWRAWRDALERSRRQTVAKIRAAKPIGDLCVLKHCFRRWTHFLKERLVEVEVDARTDLKWDQVKSWGLLS